MHIDNSKRAVVDVSYRSWTPERWVADLRILSHGRLDSINVSCDCASLFLMAVFFIFMKKRNKMSALSATEFMH